MSDPATIWQGPATTIPVVNTDGNIYEQTIVATAAQTLFTLTTFNYTPGTGSIFVFRNGSMLRRAVDYVETSATQITYAAGAVVGDKFTFIAFAIADVDPPVTLNGLPAGGTAGQVLTKVDSTDYNAGWQALTALTTLLDSARQNVASASTVDLSGAISSQTRNIQITGTTQIDGFQITNGQLWAVKFASPLTLKNNASIVTESGYDIKVSPNDTCFIRATAANIVEVLGYVRAASSMARLENDFRLTLSSGVPVPVADVTGATNIYCTPYLGNKLSLFNGTSWVLRESNEFSIALAGLTVTRPYDVFCYDNAGTPTLELLAWTSGTARATGLTRQDGVLTKTGDPTRRYMGTFYALTATTTEDSARRRLLWNMYNRVDRGMLRQETAGTWNYTLGTIRQVNANPLNQLEIVVGVQEDTWDVETSVNVSNTNTGVTVSSIIGYNSTAAIATGSTFGQMTTAVVSGFVQPKAKYVTQPVIGYQYAAWCENSAATGTTTWNGTTASGISAKWRC